MTQRQGTGKKLAKKRVMTSYDKLSEELQNQLKECYPLGFNDHLTRVDKPNGDFFHGVMLETDDTSYFVKINVKVDNKTREDIEKDLFDAVDNVEEIKAPEEIATDEAEQDDE